MAFRCFPVSVAHATRDCRLGAHKASAFVALVLVVMMSVDVLGLGSAQFKVLDPVVSSDAVDVMNGFPLQERSAKVAFHHESMHQEDATTAIYYQITHRVDGAMATAPTRALVASARPVVISHALPRATERLVSGKSPRRYLKRFATRNAGDIVHVASLPQLYRQERGK